MILKRIIHFVGATDLAYQLVVFVSAVIPGVIAFMSGMFESLPMAGAIAWATWAAAGGSVVGMSVLWAFHSVPIYFGSRTEVMDVAKKLGELHEAGHEWIPAKLVVEIWSGDHVDKLWIYNPRLRKLKQAVADGLVESVFKDRDTPTHENVMLNTSALVALFKGRKITQLKGIEEWREGTT